MGPEQIPAEMSELPYGACGATETAAILDGAATGYVLCDGCAARDNKG